MLSLSINYIKDAHVSWLWISRSGHYHAGNGDSTNDAIEHLPDCTGFDWEPPPKTHEWKVGDWFVIEKRHDALVSWGWTKEMDSMIGIPQQISSSTWRGIVSKDGRFWHPSWCRPCDPPKEDTKGEPEPETKGELVYIEVPMFPTCEIVGVHEEIYEKIYGHI